MEAIKQTTKPVLTFPYCNIITFLKWVINYPTLNCLFLIYTFFIILDDFVPNNISNKPNDDQGDIKEHKNGQISGTKSKYKCKECGKVFKKRGAFLVHKRSHSEYKPFECDKCNKKFSSDAILERHILRHDKAKPNSCDVCDKSFYKRKYFIIIIFFI